MLCIFKIIFRFSSHVIKKSSESIHSFYFLKLFLDCLRHQEKPDEVQVLVLVAAAAGGVSKTKK